MIRVVCWTKQASKMVIFLTQNVLRPKRKKVPFKTQHRQIEIDPQIIIETKFVAFSSRN